jgi:parvulin-like peptidyl-prolyl isomerase
MLKALQTATAPELIALLLRFELAEPLLLALKEKELVGSSLEGIPPANSQPPFFSAGAISPLKPTQPPAQSGQPPEQGSMDPADVAAAAIASYCKHHQLPSEEALTQWCFRHALSPAALLAEAQDLQQRQAPAGDGIPGSEESLFLRFKDRLDRVLYGLIRVDNEALARDLFFAIEAGELRFGDAARLHSSGPEARTEGIVGPVDLATPHPEISSRLRVASPGELILPFKLEQWHIILRLDYRFEASLDPGTRQFLRDLSLRSQAREAIESELIALAAWVQEPGQGLAR